MKKSRSLVRSAGIRLPKKKFIIITEGKNTEPDYFYALKQILNGTLIEVEIVGASGVPLTIAKKASDKLREIRRQSRKTFSFRDRDEVWIVFDRDTHPNIPEAKAMCRDVGVGVAFSNPCFELWLILHFTDFDRPDDHHQVQKHFNTVCPDYDPNGRKTTNCNKLIPQLEIAEARAEKQFNRREQEGDPIGAPFTTVYRLTKQMRLENETYERALKK